jgi:hypothetical protein
MPSYSAGDRVIVNVKLRPKLLILLGFCRRRRLPKVPKKDYNDTYFFGAMSCLSRNRLKPNSARKSPLKNSRMMPSRKLESCPAVAGESLHGKAHGGRIVLERPTDGNHF